MKDLRFWSVVLAGAWFLVGLGVGVAVSKPEPNPSPLASYADEFSEQFQLSKHRRRVLLQLLDDYETKRDEINQRHAAATRHAREPDYSALDARYQDTIRNTILPLNQREHFDELGQPLPQIAARTL